MIVTYNWHSLKSIIINDIRFTLSCATDGNGELTCSRADIRKFVNGYPTRSGVVLKPWELFQLGKFVRSYIAGNDEHHKSFDELSIETTCDGVSLSKQHNRVIVCRKDLETLSSYIPGFVFIMGQITPTLNPTVTPMKILEDAFIFSTLISEFKSFNEEWKEEEFVRSGKLPADMIRSLKQNGEKIWEHYVDNFAHMILKISECDKNEFLKRVQGYFLKGLINLQTSDPEVFRSLALVLREFGDYK